MVLYSLFMSLNCRISYWSSQGFPTCSHMGFRSRPRWATANFNSWDSQYCKYFITFHWIFSLVETLKVSLADWPQIISASTDSVLFLWENWDLLFHVTLLLRKLWFNSALDNHSKFHVKMLKAVPVCWKKIQNYLSQQWHLVGLRKKVRGGFGVFCLLELAVMGDTKAKERKPWMSWIKDVH